MRVITLLNEKGGVGKTTLANAIGAGLAIRGQRVLLIDADPQANLTVGLGVKPEPVLYDVMVRGAVFSNAVVEVPPEIYESPDQPTQGTLLLLPGHKETRSIAGQTDNAWVLADRLESLDDDIDVAIIDTSPTPSLFHSVIYIATEYVVYPTELEFYSFNGLVNSVTARQSFSSERVKYGRTEITILGIVPTRFRKKTLQHIENLNALQQRFGVMVWPAITESIVWGEAAQFQRSIFSHAPNSHAAKQAWKMVERASEVINEGR